MSGFYLLHRGWQDHAVFRNEAFSRRDAFVWLIEQAAYEAERVFAGTVEIRISRGQLSHSLRFMAKAWKWDEARVRRFLSSLQKAKIIDASTDAGQTVITVCNYDKYQTFSRQPDAPSDAEPTRRRRGGDAKKKEGKELKNNTPPTPPPGGARAKARFPQDWQLPEVADLPPKARACAEQWTAASYETHGEAFAAYWRGNGKMMVDWRATWANRVVALHGQVMRDQRFGNDPKPVAAPASGTPLSDAEWNARCDQFAENFRKMGREHDAREWEAKKRQPKPVGNPRRNGGVHAIGDLLEPMRGVA